MQHQEDITGCYDKAAKDYALKFKNELDAKHLDRILLRSFAAENKDKGKFIDLGCGPGQTTNFVYDCGITDITGADLSANMIAEAKKLYPSIRFETADMLQLHFPDQSFGAAIAFYAIVNFDCEQVKIAFKEINRVLIKGGQFLFSFHTGDRVVHLDNFLGHEVNIDFYFMDADKIINLLGETGFEIIDVIERHPYTETEYASRRAYIWAKRTQVKIFTNT